MARDWMRQLTGVVCPQVTPFRDGCFDDDAFVFLCERQIARGAAALAPLGLWSEAAGLDRDDRRRAIRLAVEVARGRVPVIAGGGVNYTTIAIDLARQAEELGADGILCPVPYHDQTTQDGIVGHIQAVAGATRLPLLILDRPVRRGQALGADAVLSLASSGSVAGLIDTTGDLARADSVRRRLGPDFLLLCGFSEVLEGFLDLGVQATFSPVANIVPALCGAVHRAWSGGDSASLKTHAGVLTRLQAALAVDTDPPPLQWALASLGLGRDSRRQPLTEDGIGREAVLRSALDAAVAAEGMLSGGVGATARSPRHRTKRRKVSALSNNAKTFCCGVA